MTDCGFGYVEIKDGMIVCYTGDSKNPIIHKFHNDEIVNDHEIVNRLKKRIEEIIEYNGTIPYLIENGILYELQKILGEEK